MHSTHHRKVHVHGVLLGIAIGDALGLARRGLRRRVALKMLGRPPRYDLIPGRGIYGDDTRLAILNAQALLNCRSDLRNFRRAFSWRLSWYAVSLPPGIGLSTWCAAFKCWLMRFSLPSGVRSIDNGAAARALFSALAIHGTGHRLQKWSEESTKLTHTHPLAIAGCHALAVLADCAANSKPGELVAQDALQRAIGDATQPEIAEKLKQLQPFLETRRSPFAVARYFGWDDGVNGSIVPTTVMAAYCWLRSPTDFKKAVGSAIALGGDTSSMGAVVGGLVGAHVGQPGLPSDLVGGLRGFPHGTAWMNELAERFSHWPHGADDLHLAPAQSSDPLLQLTRNATLLPVFLLHFLMRLPFRLLTEATPKRRRR